MKTIDYLAICRSKWVGEIAEVMVPELFPRKNRTPAFAKKWFERLILKINQHFQAEATPKQLKQPIWQIRKCIAIISETHPALEIVRLTKEQYFQINKESTDEVEQRALNLIKNPQAIVNKAQDVLQSSKQWPEITAALALTTGRRVSELLKTATFTQKSEFSVLFSGAIKRPPKEKPIVFEIPTLIQASTLCTALDTIRQNLNTQNIPVHELAANSSRYIQKVTHASNHIFKGLIEPRTNKKNLYTHLFRGIYGTIAVHWYCPPNVPDIEFRAQILGHFQIKDEKDQKLRRSIAADRHYYDYKIADKNGNIDGRQGIKLNQKGVIVIEAFRKIAKQQSHLTSIKALDIDKGLIIYLQKRFELINQQQALSKATELALVGLNVADTLNIPTETVIETLQSPNKLIEALLSSPHTQNLYKAPQEGLQPQQGKATGNADGLSKEQSKPGPHKFAIAQEKLEMVNAIIDHIIEFNLSPKTQPQKRWAISIFTIKQTFRVSQKIVTRAFNQRKEDIKAHHQTLEISPRQNAKHHIPINEAIATLAQFPLKVQQKIR